MSDSAEKSADSSAEKVDHQPIIIIKKVIKKPAHHGGAWKIAYADFVTAMMAFFLLMWLLSMLNKFQLMGISNYFSKPNKNTYVDNEKNDTEDKKIPAEQTKQYKLVLTHKRKAELDAKSFGVDKSGLHEKEVSKDDKKTAFGGSNENAMSKHTQKAVDEFDASEMKSLQALKKRLEASAANNDRLKQYQENLTFEITKDGLKIKLGSLEDQPMFTTGKADFEIYAADILEWLAGEVSPANRYISIIGHTDGDQFPAYAKYSNWELSADRANAARRSLIKYGANPHKFIRVQGAGDSILLDPKFAANPKNRRIEIILLSDSAAKKMLEKD